MITKFSKVLIKISGEALMGKQRYGIDPSMLSYVAEQIKTVINLGVKLSIVVGGGNIFRGGSYNFLKIKRTSGDYIGMLATMINCLALKNELEKKGIIAKIQSAIPMNPIAEPYNLEIALNYLEMGHVVIFGAGSGNPYFTTDTAAVLRAKETNSEVLLKATKVDYLYNYDPEKKINAKPIKNIKYIDVIKRQLKIMDMAAISLAMENFLPIIIFNINGIDNIKNIILGHNVGTFITN